MGHLLRVLARYLVPFLLARDGYFFCRNACSSLMASATDFLLLMSSWLLHILKHKKAAYLALCLQPSVEMPVSINL